MAMAVGVCVGCATTQPPPGQPELKSLDIKGNHQVSAKSIKKKLASTEDNHFPFTLWRLPFTEVQYLDESVLEDDLRRVVRFYQVHGYFSARVTGVDIEPPLAEKPDRVSVVIHVDEGPVTNVTNLEVSGIETLPPSDQSRLRKLIKLEEGKPFDEDLYEQGKTELRNDLREHAYARAEVVGHVEVDPEHQTAKVSFSLKPGEKYRFGNSSVVGNHLVAARAIERQAEAVARPDTNFSDSAIRDTQTRVSNMGVFAMAKVSAGEPDDLKLEVPVLVDVREAPFRTIRVGGSLGFEPSRQELNGQFEWVHRNLFGDLRKLDFNNRIGYVVTPNLLSLFSSSSHSSNQGLAGFSKLSFSQPDFLESRFDLQSSFELRRDVQVGYTYQSATLNVGVVRRWGTHLEFAPSYTYELFRYLPQAVVDPLSQSQAPQLSISCPKNQPTCLLHLSYLEQRIVYDQRDNRIEPHRGYMAMLDLQEGGGPLADFVYLRAEPELRAYFSLTNDLVVGLRGQLGWMRSYRFEGGVRLPTPVTQRFIAGGANSVRAYGSNLMSPVEVVCRKQPCDPHNPDDFEALPVGGDGKYEASLELRYSINADFGVVLFVDTGSVTVNPFEFKLIDLAIAPGIGFRYKTSFGPVRLDFAYRLPSLGPDDGLLRLAPSQVVLNYPPPPGTPFAFLPPTPRFNFQFSIGEAF